MLRNKLNANSQAIHASTRLSQNLYACIQPINMMRVVDVSSTLISIRLVIGNVKIESTKGALFL